MTLPNYLTGIGTTSRSAEGMLLAGRKINVALLIQDMREERIDTWKISSLLKPHDAQNVACAVELILTLRRMGESWKDRTLNPSQRDRRRSLAVFGHFYGSFLEAHINRQLSLSQQLRLLSKYSHLGVILFKVAGTRLMPSQLYADSMSCAKNAFVTVIKQQKLDGTQRVFLILEGSDPLEELYGVIRMMGGHNPNFDTNGFCDLANGALDLTAVFARYPEWRAAIRRLSVSVSVGKAADLQRVRDWQGDLIADHADPELEWDGGLDEVQDLNDELELSDMHLRTHYSNGEADSLRPLGDGSYVGKERPGKPLEKDRSMEEPEPFDTATEAALTQPDPTAPEQHSAAVASDSASAAAPAGELLISASDLPLESDQSDIDDEPALLEDELQAAVPELLEAESSSSAMATSFRDEVTAQAASAASEAGTTTEIVDHVFTDTGRKVYKVSHINISFNSSQRHQSKERLERVQGYKSTTLAISDSPTLSSSEDFAVGLLFATLMRYKSGAFLAVMECTEIRRAGVSMLANPVARADLLIPANNYTLRGSVYTFVSTAGDRDGASNGLNRWQWIPSSHVHFRPPSKSPKARDTVDFQVPGVAAVVISPRLEVFERRTSDGLLTWTLSSEEMTALAARVHEQVDPAHLSKLPLCGISTVGTFPYTRANGMHFDRVRSNADVVQEITHSRSQALYLRPQTLYGLVRFVWQMWMAQNASTTTLST
jgi:hypothetical protein